MFNMNTIFVINKCSFEIIIFIKLYDIFSTFFTIGGINKQKQFHKDSHFMNSICLLKLYEFALDKFKMFRFWI